jgi:hypothetical protein
MARALPVGRTNIFGKTYGEIMRRSLIPWHVFREALECQRAAGLENWLARWGFTNDGVVLIGADTAARSQPLSFNAQYMGTDTPQSSQHTSLQELLLFLNRAVPLVANLWSYNKDL